MPCPNLNKVRVLDTVGQGMCTHSECEHAHGEHIISKARSLLRRIPKYTHVAKNMFFA